MTLEIRSQVKGQSRYDLEICRKDVKLFEGKVYQVSRRSADPFASNSRKNPRGLHRPRPVVPARVNSCTVRGLIQPQGFSCRSKLLNRSVVIFFIAYGVF